MKKLFAIILSALLIITMCTVTAFALDARVDLSEQDGRLEITEEGSYILTGTLQGTVYVDPGEGDVELILDGADIYGGENPGIYAVSGDSLTISLPEGSVNRISGNEGNLYSATIYSYIDVTFDGDGALYVISGNENGISTEDADLTFDGGSYAITAPENGIAADGQEQGELTVNDGHFSILAENTVDSEANFFMNGGAFDEPFPENLSINGQPPQMNGQQPQMNGQQTQMNGQRPPEMQNGTQQSRQSGQQPPQMNNSSQQPQMNGNMPQNGQQNNSSSSSSASRIVSGTMTNSAADLEADYENATYITVSDDNSHIKITSSGTYVVSGTCSDGNITVKKGTTGVVLVLEDLNLTSTTGATVSVNKEAEVKIIISGSVVLTDNENPDDEYSSDADVADAYDGAALKAKANSSAYVTGGTLTINGTFNIAAGDDAIHADHILSIGSEDGTGPTIKVTKSNEALEGTVVNIYGGDISIVSSDDAINAANADSAYEGELDYSFNMMGGKVVINSKGDGVDSNGNVNLIDGSLTINSASGGGNFGRGADVTINGGSVIAGGGAYYGSAIGGGRSGHPGSVTIAEGFTIKAGNDQAGAEEVSAEAFTAAHDQRWVKIYVDSSAEEPTEPATVKYYVIGTFTNWEVDESYELTLNEAAETEEYLFEGLDLTTTDEFKVVKVETGTDNVWYPDGMDVNYGANGEITSDGTYTVYFRPDYDGGEDWFCNCIYAEAPAVEPTDAPTEDPTEAPTEAPTYAPTEAPTEAPTDAPTEAPTEAPTDAPTEAPTDAPTEAPTDAPTEATTEAPTVEPTEAPTDAPTEAPTDEPTEPAVSTPEYYVVGTMTGWQLDESYKMVRNDEAEGEEFMLNDLELTSTDAFKIVKYEEGKDWTWFPGGTGNNCEIEADGTYNIYFRPNYDGEDWYCDCIYVANVTPEPTDEPTVDPTDAPTDSPTEAPTDAPTEAPTDAPTEAQGEDRILIGDVNGDGKVDNRDAMILDRYIAGWIGYDSYIVNMIAADMNQDGEVTNRDAMIIDRYVAGWDGYDKYTVYVPIAA